MTRSDGPEGLLLVDKPEGPTSHDVVQVVRRALRTRRVGHAGTLDPFATGLLACCCGTATRLVRFLSGSEKTYEGVIRLGHATDTGDLTGTPLTPERPVGDAAAHAAAEVERTLTGTLEQVPPMWSAKKVEGVPLHRLARRGATVERKPVLVRVGGWEIVPIDETRLRFCVTCSAGTYVRVLAADLGERLGCGAHLESLRRVRSGALRLQDALRVDELTPEAALARLVPVSAIPLPLPSLHAAEPTQQAFVHGRPTPLTAWARRGEEGSAGGTADLAEGAEIACRTLDGALLGIGVVRVRQLAPSVVLAG